MARGLTKKSVLLLLAFGLFVQLHASCGPINRVKGASHDKTSLELNASERIWRFFKTKKRTE